MAGRRKAGDDATMSGGSMPVVSSFRSVVRSRRIRSRRCVRWATARSSGSQSCASTTRGSGSSRHGRSGPCVTPCSRSRSSVAEWTPSNESSVDKRDASFGRPVQP